MRPTALGFRVKSGYAVAVALRGPAAAPVVAARRVVELSDPDVPESRQPFHRALFTHETERARIDGLVKIVERCARRAVDALVEDPPFADCRAAALVVGSVIDPAAVGNPHIRAHASEGQLFRTALRSALTAHGIGCDIFVEKELGPEASARLKRTNAEIARVVLRLGKEIGGPWRADEKAASTAAWILLR
jgi:hypothetical protein